MNPEELPDQIIRSVPEYIEFVMSTHGSIQQLNRIGALTVITAYRRLGEFETVVWDSREPENQDVGTVVSYWSTLEISSAFHYAYTKRLYASPFGGVERWWCKKSRPLVKAAREAVAEVTRDFD